MNYRKLGTNGPEVSEIGFGAWAIGGGWGQQAEDDSLAALHEALDGGVNFIDTAQAYGNGRSEKIIGRVLAERSERIHVATKIAPTGSGSWPPSPYCDHENRYPDDYLAKALDERLSNLGVDCIDVLQLHTWTRAWNRDPRPFETLRKFREQGKVRLIGLSTPEHDQNAVIELMREGWVDTVQVIYNIFEQEPAAELLPTAQEHGVGVIVRVALEEGALAGKFTADKTFEDGDFRRYYFAGDRLERTVQRVERIRKDVEPTDYTMVQAALKFPLMHPAVSTVIAGMRNPDQARANAAVSDLPPLSDELVEKLRGHRWNRAFWYAGK